MLDWDQMLLPAHTDTDDVPDLGEPPLPDITSGRDTSGTADLGESSELPGIESQQRRDDDRRYCIECSNLDTSRRCLAAQRGQIVAARGYTPIRDLLRRCEGYQPLPADPDQRRGRDRWPVLGHSFGARDATS